VLLWSWLACGPSAEECAAQAAALLAADPRHPDAAEALSCACDGGVAEACTRLAAAHRDGAAPDLDASLARYRQACDLGDGAGCNGVGAALTAGWGVERDPAAAHAAFERGCRAEAPSARACSNAGNDLFTGRIGRQDFAAAADRFDRGCRLGDAPSCEQLRAARDPAGAARRFQQGCALGDSGACLNLAVVLPLADPERARLLELACASGLDVACALRE
jgi:TPR repeat protein